MNVAIFLGSGIDSGGGYQYEYKVIEILKKYLDSQKVNLRYYTINHNIVKDYAALHIPINVIQENMLQTVHRMSLSNVYFYKVWKKIKLEYSKVECILLKDNIDLVYFLSPSFLSQCLNDIPYIFTLWDLGHIDVLEFPEVRCNREFELREILYTKSLRKAFRVIVDSEYGKKNVIQKYNLDKKRVEVLKFIPNIKVIKQRRNIDVKKKYCIKNDYIFYPAQFWAHKNHIYILKAIKILKEEKNIVLEAIFSGSDKGNLKYILQKAKEYNISDLVHYIGFVPNDEIPALYKQSLSLVMPTYMGPTNIPPLEAFAYRVPVCYADTSFFREQVGDAVFFIDLSNPYSLVDNLIQIKNNKKIVVEKILQGTRILQNWDDKDFYYKLFAIFQEYQYVRELWGNR